MNDVLTDSLQADEDESVVLKVNPQTSDLKITGCNINIFYVAP